MSLNIGAPPAYRDLSGAELISYCRDDASKWAAAFCQMFSGYMVCSGKLAEATMMSWFANAIEAACDHRARKTSAPKRTVSLFAKHGNFITEIDMPLQDRPGAIYWGSRFFVRDGGGYVEVDDVFTAPESDRVTSTADALIKPKREEWR